MTDTHEPQTPSVRHANGRFVPGNPGRPRGARNVSSQRAMRAILDDFHNNQDELLRTLRQESPIEYVRMITKVLPRQVEVEPLTPVEEWSDESVVRALIEVKRTIAIEASPRAALKGVEAIFASPPSSGVQA